MYFSDSEQVIRELGAVFPPVPPSDPIYVDIVEGHMVVPGVIFAGQDQLTHSDHPAGSGTAQDIMLENTESCNNAEWEEDDTCMPGPSRFDWKLTFTRKLLSILEEMKKRTGKDFALTKAVWPKLEKEMSKTCSPAPTAIQCREKFYSLKRSYRKYVMESKKTGNKTPKPFHYESEMQLILEGDPAFKPLLLKSSFGAVEINNNIEEDSSSDEKEAEDKNNASCSSSDHTRKSKTTRKRKRDDLKEFLAERDEKFLSAMKEMQSQNNALLEKLIDKMN